MKSGGSLTAYRAAHRRCSGTDCDKKISIWKACASGKYYNLRYTGTLIVKDITSILIAPMSVDDAASKGYIFTPSQDWFSLNIPIWEPHIDTLLSTIPVGRAPRALEVGTWEGRSAVYILTKLCNTPDSLFVCIDHFDFLLSDAGRERHAKVVHNLTLTGSPFRILDDFSTPGLMTLLNEGAVNQDGGFDLVYIDGSHEADDTFLDAELAWRITRPGGLFILDDYMWDREPTTSIHHPARGINAFLSLHEGQFEVLHKDYQVILRKTVKLRIGFLPKSVSSYTSETDFFDGIEYGVYVAMCIDNSYAMAAAVVLRSAIDATSGRITFYIVDCGLQPEDKHKLEASIPQTRANEVTLMYHSLPPESRGLRQPTWAKVDMLMHLPVEHYIYLDADVLVRRDLKDLFRTDMGGKPIGAVRDVGYPMGHPGLPEGVRGRHYFNAGVLLVDQSLIRQRVPEMKIAFSALKETEKKDQDFLNVFFSVDFFELDIVWNAGGLGTYASWPYDDRDKIWPQGVLATLLADPAIVHFTGPLHPSMTSVLDDNIQPWLSKPWGYAGAPGHPFADLWWEVLEKTAWKGMRQDKTFKESLIVARKAAVEECLQEFERRIPVAVI